MSTALLPPHTEAGTAATDTGTLNLDAFAQALAATPMEDYSKPEVPEQPQQPQPKPAPEAPPTDAPKGEGGGAAGPAPEPEKRNVESARELIEGYDLLQAWGFSTLSDGMAPDKFALDKFPKERAVHHLAKGLEKMGSPEVPWWFGLVLALAIPAFINYRTAIGFRKAKAQERAQRNRSAAGTGQPLHPDSITDRNGQRVDVPPPPPPAATPASTAPPPGDNSPHTVLQHPAARMRPVKNYGPCEVCGNPVHRPKARYCGKSCSGKALNERLRAKRAQP